MLLIMVQPVMTAQSSVHTQDHLWALNKPITASKHYNSKDFKFNILCAEHVLIQILNIMLY